MSAGEALSVLSPLRVEFYDSLYARPDTPFGLADAILCTGGPVRTPIGLSLAAEHRRDHGALYASLDRGWAEPRPDRPSRRPGRASTLGPGHAPRPRPRLVRAEGRAAAPARRRPRLRPARHLADPDATTATRYGKAATKAPGTDGPAAHPTVAPDWNTRRKNSACTRTRWRG